jgi:DNA-damage-inducible protein D
MEKQLVIRLHKNFEDAAYQENGVEYWMARDIQELLGYDEWRNFTNVIDKAEIACKNARQDVSDHFVDVNKMVPLGSGSERAIADIMLTRYACYLIAQNGDPRKEQIAFAQSYFAFQTRKQELLEERIDLIERLRAREKLVATETELSKLIFERGVDHQGVWTHPQQGRSGAFWRIDNPPDEKETGDSRQQTSCGFSADDHHKGQRSCHRDHQLQC